MFSLKRKCKMNSTTIDFYTGTGLISQWIGSCIGDNIYDLPNSLLKQTNWFKYLKEVYKYLNKQTPNFIRYRGNSWDWDWPNSSGSNYSFYFDHVSNQVLVACSMYEYYCMPLLLKNGYSLLEAKTDEIVRYVPMKTYTTVNKKGEIIIINGQYSP
jgi:hypothetical protein